MRMNSYTPCCKQRVRLRANPLLPQQKYERKCKGCGFEWTIHRTFIKVIDGKRFDKLEWSRGY